MNFNWKEFKSNQNIWVHCKTKEESLDFIGNGYKHACVLNMFHGQIWSIAKEKGIYYTINYDKLQCKYTLPIVYKEIIEWSDYMEKEKTIFETIAEYIGKKIDEEFKLEGDDLNIYRINDKEGLQYKCSDGWYCSQCLNRLLIGNLKIKEESKITDRQMSLLNALYTLGFRWIFKNIYDYAIVSEMKPINYGKYGWSVPCTDLNSDGLIPILEELKELSLLKYGEALEIEKIIKK